MSSITSNGRVRVSNQLVVTLADTFPIAGLVFTLPVIGPHPCITAKWITSATRILINGQPVILNDSVGLCQSADQSPQGPPNVIATQPRVKGI